MGKQSKVAKEWSERQKFEQENRGKWVSEHRDSWLGDEGDCTMETIGIL